MKRATYIGFLLTVIVMLVFSQQRSGPITRDGLLGALQTRALSGRELLSEVKRYGVSFELSAKDEERIRGAGKYLGKKGLDDLIVATRNNYRPNNSDAAIPREDQPNAQDVPLTFWNGIAIKGSPKPERLDQIMIRAGYRGSTSMSALMVSNGEMNGSEIFIGTNETLTTKNGQLLYPGSQFNFPGGENTTRVYILSPKDVQIDVTYKPRAISPIAQPSPSPRPTPTPDWKESDEAKRLANEITNEIQQLIDEGTVADLTDYQKALSWYSLWIEKCSVTLGRVDIKLRRFTTEPDETLKEGFDNATASGRRMKPDVKEFSSYDREMLRSEIRIALLRLDYAKKYVHIYTRPDADAIREGLPGVKRP
jgi:hypothetical protein